MNIEPWSPYLGGTYLPSKGRITLTAAFADVVSLLAGFQAYELPEIFSAPEDDGKNDACRHLVCIDAETMAEQFIAGRIATFARPLNGGEVTPIDSALWEIDNPLPRFATGTFNLECWMNPQATPTHRIFVDSEQFDDWLAKLKPYGPLSNQQIEEATNSQLRARRAVARRNLVAVPKDTENSVAQMPANRASSEIELIDIKAVSDIISLSRSTIYARIQNGQFPDGIKLGRSTRWRKSDVLLWVEEQAAGQTH
ncbi:helix-turn-helix transcriptional regulator [Croceicoccus hydrothermalis]|uniref:helix-turn-helix transcriptional regulator n=1 Tax=Croceicoccus hydrothermalis TaxID=2867964 RepID=UPI001EFA9427|nr:AlpA family phage regulatory protein [Croceicoccus hydrothermalis]